MKVLRKNLLLFAECLIKYSRMIKLIAVFIILFSCVSPAFAECCTFTGQITVENYHSKTKNSGKIATFHHCCCSHHDCSDRATFTSGTVLITASDVILPMTEEPLVPSFITGPLLEPPAYV